MYMIAYCNLHHSIEIAEIVPHSIVGEGGRIAAVLLVAVIARCGSWSMNSSSMFCGCQAAGLEPSEYEALELPKNMENDDDLEDLTPYNEIDPESEGEDEGEEDDSPTERRHKRTIASPGVLWPKGIVPFVFSETLCK